MADLLQLPAGYPQSYLTLSAAPCKKRDNSLSPTRPGYRDADTKCVRVARLVSADWLRLADTSDGPDACWPTFGAIHPDGYAQSWFSDLKRGMPVARVVLAETLGRPIAPDMYACHTCDNRACLNPQHIYEGTPQQNGRDKAARGRARNAYTKVTLGPVVTASAHGVELRRSNSPGEPR